MAGDFNKDVLMALLNGTERKVYSEELDLVDPDYKSSVKAIAGTGVPVKCFKENETGRLYYRIVPEVSGAGSTAPAVEKGRKSASPVSKESAKLSGSPPAPASNISPAAAPLREDAKPPAGIPAAVFRASEIRVSISGKKASVVLVPLGHSDALLASEFSMRMGQDAPGDLCLVTLKASSSIRAEAPPAPPSVAKIPSLHTGGVQDVFGEKLTDEEIVELQDKATAHAGRALEAAAERPVADVSADLDRLAALGTLSASAVLGMKNLLSGSPGVDFNGQGDGPARRPI